MAKEVVAGKEKKCFLMEISNKKKIDKFTFFLVKHQDEKQKPRQQCSIFCVQGVYAKISQTCFSLF